MPKIEQFEKYSNEYDEWFDNHSDVYAVELEAIRQLISPAGAKGIEVGVGSGKFAVPLGIKIGVEPSEKMASKARLQGIDVYSGIAEELPFSDELFDFVLVVTTICFVDDVSKSLKEACRVLKPDGFIIVGFIDRESEIGKQYSEKKRKQQILQRCHLLLNSRTAKVSQGIGICGHERFANPYSWRITQNHSGRLRKGCFCRDQGYENYYE